jgi:hypothetical protein
VILYLFIRHFNEDEIAHDRFQQGSAAAYTTRVSMTLLRDVFGGRIISKAFGHHGRQNSHPPINIFGGN